MSTEGVRREVQAMAEAARRVGLQPDDDLAVLLRTVASVAREMAEAMDELRNTKQIDRDIIAAVERASNAIAFRIRHSIDRRLSVLVSSWLIAAAVLGSAATCAGLWLRGVL